MLSVVHCTSKCWCAVIRQHSSSATTGAVMSAETVPVPGNEVLPAGSVLLQSLYRHPPGYLGLVLT
ncbi:hypothetical protein, partial [Acinetobacter baumannii]|uniref:hypothetical protein n=1 Tax=Acinetobacter baumannii TaxID=470 RepID=UPI00405748D8